MNVCSIVLHKIHTISLCFSPLPLSNEAELIRHLLHRLYHFGMLARPVLNSSQPVFVSFGIALVQILDFDETRQLIVTNIWKNYVSQCDGILCNTYIMVR